jgi:hypothetical protein
MQRRRLMRKAPAARILLGLIFAQSAAFEAKRLERASRADVWLLVTRVRIPEHT